MKENRKRHVARWDKDGRWHVTELYIPTPQDRQSFPASYPTNDEGPFFIWSVDSYCTEAEALAAIAD